MSVETAKKFIIKVQSDEGLRSEVIALGQDYNGLIQLASKQGFAFTAQDLQAAAQASGYSTGQTIAEEDLTAVAGGTGCDCDQVQGITSWTESGCNGC